MNLDGIPTQAWSFNRQLINRSEKCLNICAHTVITYQSQILSNEEYDNNFLIGYLLILVFRNGRMIKIHILYWYQKFLVNKCRNLPEMAQIR